MPEENKPMPRMSLDQAFNYVDELKENAEDTAKKHSAEKPISMALPGDRIKFLAYGINLLEDITESDKYEFCRIANAAPACYTTKEVAEIFRRILRARIEGYSHIEIAITLKKPIESIKQVEELAKQALRYQLDKIRNTRTPIIGGTN
jgi:hypothetical protein